MMTCDWDPTGYLAQKFYNEHEDLRHLTEPDLRVHMDEPMQRIGTESPGLHMASGGMEASGVLHK